jgi:hypothetical protein
MHYASFLPVDWHPQLKGETERMRRLALAVVLACVLSGIARAGEIPSTGATAPQPSSTVTTTGEIPSTGATAPQPSSTVLTIILTIIGIVR